MLPFHSRKEPQRRRKTEEPSDEEGRPRQETREMMLPSATTPSAIRTKRIARSPPLLVHDDDRKDDFVAKMYFTDDIDGGIELDWCSRWKGKISGWNDGMAVGRVGGWSTEGERGIICFILGPREWIFHSCIRLFLSETISSSLIFLLGSAPSSLTLLFLFNP